MAIMVLVFRVKIILLLTSEHLAGFRVLSFEMRDIIYCLEVIAAKYLGQKGRICISIIKKA